MGTELMEVGSCHIYIWNWVELIVHSLCIPSVCIATQYLSIGILPQYTPSVYSLSILPPVFPGAGPAPRVPFRENFARVCFEALLQFSFIHSQGSNIGRLAAATNESNTHSHAHTLSCPYPLPRLDLPASTECLIGEMWRGTGKVCQWRTAQWDLPPTQVSPHSIPTL